MIDNSGFEKVFIKRGITMYRLEKLTGVRTSRLSDIVLNKRDWKGLTYFQLELIAQAIGITVNELVEEIVSNTTSIQKGE